MQPGPSPHLRYRPEIDGLRAVAVLSVILFHADVAQLSGGFIGVDIFYVISGYLITKIIVGALHEGRFSFADFYSRRIKRLLPAAFFMLMATVLFGAIILAPDKWVELAKSAIYASVFLANFWFAANSGYFDQSAEISPLVHMWSLAVEEQFYLLFPVLIFLVHRRLGFAGVRVLIVFILVTSLLASMLISPSMPNIAFYLLPTRAWELAVGALLVLYPELAPRGRLQSQILSVAGFVLILYGLFSISEGQPFPGALALYPTLGAAFLILSAHSAGNVGQVLLTLPPVVLVGRFSYSAYLWHWPIVSYYRVYVSERAFSWQETVALIAASLVAGYFSWRFIEERSRHAKAPLSKIFLYATCAVVGMLAVPGIIYAFKGFPDRISVEARSIADSDLMWGWDCAESIRPFADSSEPYCVVGAEWAGASTRAIIWGDSHSLHWAPAFHALGAERNIAFLIAPLECPPYLNSDFVKEDYPKFPRFTENCTINHRKTVNWLNAQPDVSLIIMTAAWSGHVRMLYAATESLGSTNDQPLIDRPVGQGGDLSASALRQTLALLDLHDKRVLLLGDVPRPNRNLNECAFNELSSLLRARCTLPYEYLDAQRVREWQGSSNQVLERVALEFAQVEAIIPTSTLCDDAKCPTYLNGELLYKDTNHLRRNLHADTQRELAIKIGLADFLDSL